MFQGIVTWQEMGAAITADQWGASSCIGYKYTQLQLHYAVCAGWLMCFAAGLSQSIEQTCSTALHISHLVAMEILQPT